MILMPDLFSFAYVPNWYSQLDMLAEMALPEPWRFKNPIYLTKNPDTPILERYIHAIFKKQLIDYKDERNPSSAADYFHIENEFCCFHTGLYTCRYKPIYACFDRNKKKDSLLEWYFRGFADELSPMLRHMRIVILESSPNRHGSSNLLAERFAQGAQEAGHQVTFVDVAHADIHPCTGCVHCGYEGPCVQKDDVEGIRRQLLAADMVVFVTPLYYYGMSAQLKTMVDRFCAFNSSLQAKHLKSALLAAAWNSDTWTFAALEAHYQTLVRYLNLQDMGMVLGTGCGTPAMTARSPFPQAAYRLGRQLL